MLTNEELDSLRLEPVVYDPAWTEVFSQAKEANDLRTELDAMRAECEELETLKETIYEALPCYAEDDEAAEREERCSELETVCAAGDELKRVRAERDRLRTTAALIAEKAKLADEHASWIRRGPPLDHGNTPHDIEWFSRYSALSTNTDTKPKTESNT